MSHGLLEVVVLMIVRDATFATEIRPLVGVAAALPLAVLAGYAGWHGTNWIVVRRQRADED